MSGVPQRRSAGADLNATYLFWGMPEYVRIRRALRETVTAHTDSVKLLERSVQAIYSMKGLASLLTTDDGENQVLKRLQLVDTSRGLLNSIAIDSEGEQYDFKTFQFSGVKGCHRRDLQYAVRADEHPPDNSVWPLTGRHERHRRQ